jgi:imidazoleglycerol-phosphate dehydratase
MIREASYSRTTGETDISVEVKLLSVAKSDINSGVPFFDHMLSALARHGKMQLSVVCKGDTHIDDHHSVEDIGICLGHAIKAALGDKRGITRFGFASVPMDEALSQVSIDVSGRGYLVYNGEKLQGYIKEYSEELTLEFLQALSQNSGICIHVNLLYGTNRHHIHESIFKSLAVALRNAFEIDALSASTIPSTKGTL